jgi:nickel/cobalt transporter (NicO) family protein
LSGLLFALSAFVLGALHALEPGHGKTVVAAYLVGSRGRVRDAFLLGGVVTFTHTFSIILLGVLTVVASAYFVPETVHEVMEVVAGLLVLAVGLWMVRERILLGRSGHGHSHAHQSDHDHAHGEDEHVLVGAAAAHVHAHAHPHSEDHGLGHRHDHDVHSHAPPPAGRLSVWGLVTLGISGGMVPCPAALALLLAAVAMGNIIGGISLVVVFSLGLAAVLIAIGVALVKAAHLAGRFLGGGPDGEGRFARRAGIASALVVTALGVLITARGVLGVAGIHVLG